MTQAGSNSKHKMKHHASHLIFEINVGARLQQREYLIRTTMIGSCPQLVKSKLVQTTLYDDDSHYQTSYEKINKHNDENACDTSFSAYKICLKALDCNTKGVMSTLFPSSADFAESTMICTCEQ